MIHVVLYQPEIPPNTGNIIRTCFALGAKLHIIKPIAFELHPKYLKRSAAGKHLTDIEHEIHNKYEDFVKKYPQANIFYVTRYASQSHDQPNYLTHYHQGDIFFMFGRESTGIPKRILEANFDQCIRIPMMPKSRSLNIANSVCISLYEAYRQVGYPNLSKTEVIKGFDYLKKD